MDDGTTRRDCQKSTTSSDKRHRAVVYHVARIKSRVWIGGQLYALVSGKATDFGNVCRWGASKGQDGKDHQIGRTRAITSNYRVWCTINKTAIVILTSNTALQRAMVRPRQQQQIPHDVFVTMLLGFFGPKHLSKSLFDGIGRLRRNVQDASSG